MKKFVTKAASYALAFMLMATGVISISAQESTPDASPAAEVEETSRAITFYPEDTGEGTFITVELNPGDSTEVNVILGNSGNIEQTLRTYVIPALSGNNGGFILADYGTDADEVTSWVDYPEEGYTLQPTEGLIVPVEISVPADVTPGEYVTGLAAEQAESFEIPGTDMMRQRVRWSIPILIVVPGEREPAFELGDAELEWYGQGIYATIQIANTGNVTVRPEGEIRLLNAEGTVIGVSQVAMDSVYTGTETVFLSGWDNVPPAETYSIEVALIAEDGTVEVQQSFNGIAPLEEGESATEEREPLEFTQAELTPLTRDNPPSMLMFEGTISNSGEPVENARVSIVTYQDGVEVDRYPIMQAVTIQIGETPVEARYSLPGGFTDGAYTFEVTVELGSGSTQTVIVTESMDFVVTVSD